MDCLARAGGDGCDGRSPIVCGTYDARVKYERLDIVALGGAAFMARRDNPGICPGDGWQLFSRQGQQGRRGEEVATEVFAEKRGEKRSKQFVEGVIERMEERLRCSAELESYR